ncbi:olfactomedin-like protein 2B isoform X1 [Ictalurus furcatus]|uniref:olfactomedin-like protein 2B isoform X1 n=1 Tax=Ictalurus furcatus TaxID=66913 RepID=UPI0023505797|nr:olfactomedin-like protein 2B isoform X1 [Ictalurus furcatus]
MMMLSLRLLLLAWSGTLCFVPLAWTGVMESLSQQNQVFSEEFEDAQLEEEVDNQENVLTQLLGDYDKVKTLSEGPDCRCKCVVRPLSRSACRRIEEGTGKLEDFYTVETVTSGPNCKKCACIAPPSALNPCEGDFRFKKLQEAGKDDVKLSTIMDLLEGALYGMDLLKLHSVTTKLLARVENIEKSFSRNVTKEQGSVKGEKEQGKDSRDHHHLEKKRRLSELEPSLQNKVAAAFSHTEKKYEERFVGSQDSSRQLKRSHVEDSEEQKSVKSKMGPNGMNIRSMTFYKADTEEDDDGEQITGPDDVLSGDGSVDLIIEDQIPKQQDTQSSDPHTTATMAPTPNRETTTNVLTITKQPKQESWETERMITTSTATPLSLTTFSTTTTTTTTTQLATTNRSTSISAPPKAPKPQHNSTSAARKHTVKSRLSWDEESVVNTDSPKNSGVCKDTLATIADPVTHNTYGRNEGAWMKDPKGNGNVIYVTSYYYGSNLLEFRDMDTFKQGHISHSYKLPYNWIGTGHVVYNGAFYYNRAFSHDIIKYDLRLRYVAAWTTLHDAMFEHEDEEAPWSFRGHSDVDFAVDESGLWLVYPALDEEGFHQEVIILSKLNPSDLQKETTWRTGLRRNSYGNSFVICGVLYAVDSYERINATISYAFDTHTHTQMVPRLPFVNNYTYTTQIDYNPKDRTLYAWDNGHQVTYEVIFAY